MSRFVGVDGKSYSLLEASAGLLEKRELPEFPQRVEGTDCENGEEWLTGSSFASKWVFLGAEFSCSCWVWLAGPNVLNLLIPPTNGL